MRVDQTSTVNPTIFCAWTGTRDGALGIAVNVVHNRIDIRDAVASGTLTIVGIADRNAILQTNGYTGRKDIAAVKTNRTFDLVGS